MVVSFDCEVNHNNDFCYDNMIEVYSNTVARSSAELLIKFAITLGDLSNPFLNQS